MTLLMGGFKWIEVGGSLGFFFPSIDWSRKYKDSMNWVCTFFLIPVIQFTEIVLRVLWLVEVCHIRTRVWISVIDLPFFFLQLKILLVYHLSREEFSN